MHLTVSNFHHTRGVNNIFFFLLLMHELIKIELPFLIFFTENALVDWNSALYANIFGILREIYFNNLHCGTCKFISLGSKEFLRSSLGFPFRAFGGVIHKNKQMLHCPIFFLSQTV